MFVDLADQAGFGRAIGFLCDDCRAKQGPEAEAPRPERSERPALRRSERPTRGRHSRPPPPPVERVAADVEPRARESASAVIERSEEPRRRVANAPPARPERHVEDETPTVPLASPRQARTPPPTFAPDLTLPPPVQSSNRGWIAGGLLVAIAAAGVALWSSSRRDADSAAATAAPTATVDPRGAAPSTAPVAATPASPPTSETRGASVPAVQPGSYPTNTARPFDPPSGAAPPFPGPATFDKEAANAAILAMADRAGACKKAGDAGGMARLSIVFAASGKVTTARVLGPPFAATPAGSCMAKLFREITVPAFEGEPVTVEKTVPVR